MDNNTATIHNDLIQPLIDSSSTTSLFSDNSEQSSYRSVSNAHISMDGISSSGSESDNEDEDDDNSRDLFNSSNHNSKKVHAKLKFTDSRSNGASGNYSVRHNPKRKTAWYHVSIVVKM